MKFLNKTLQVDSPVLWCGAWEGRLVWCSALSQHTRGCVALALRGHSPEGEAALQHLGAWIYGGFLYVLIKKILAYLEALLTLKTFISSTLSHFQGQGLEPVLVGVSGTCWLCSAPPVLLRVCSDSLLLTQECRHAACEVILWTLSCFGSPWEGFLPGTGLSKLRAVQTSYCTRHSWVSCCTQNNAFLHSSRIC